jgi:hypothetical protein
LEITLPDAIYQWLLQESQNRTQDVSIIVQAALEQYAQRVGLTITTSQSRFEVRPDTLPAPDAFVECAGTWEFEPGELEEILQDIERSRLMEFEEGRVVYLGY